MRKPKTFSRAGWLSAGLSVTLLGQLAACGSADNPTAATSSRSAKSRKLHKPVATKPGEEDLAEMVAAVSATKSGPPVEMKFSLSQRPEVGQVLNVGVAVIPLAPAPDSICVTFQAGDGLDIVDGSQLALVNKPTEGQPLRHVLRIMPKRDGIFTVIAVVTLGPATLNTTRTFSIPVIAGEGLRGQVAKGS